MRRLLATYAVIFAALIGAWQCFAQVPMTGAGLGRPGFTSSCSQSTNFLARAAGITLTADKTNYDNLICHGVTHGWFTKCDAVYIYAAPTQATALLNLVQATYNSTANGTVSFSAGHGFTGDGSTFYIDTAMNPNSGTPNYVTASAAFGAYDLTNRASGGNQYAMGVATTTHASVTGYDFGQSAWTMNSGSSEAGGASSGTLGFWQVSVISTVNSGTSVLYHNGGSAANGANASTAVPTANFYVFAENAGGAALFNSEQLSEAHICGGLTAADISNQSTDVNAFMTAYGINVY